MKEYKEIKREIEIIRKERGISDVIKKQRRNEELNDERRKLPCACGEDEAEKKGIGHDD